MSEHPHEAELCALLAETARADVTGIGLEDDLVRELGLDSLAGLRLLAGVEKRFGVRFPDDRLSEFRTMRQLLEFIASAQTGEQTDEDGHESGPTEQRA